MVSPCLCLYNPWEKQINSSHPRGGKLSQTIVGATIFSEMKAISPESIRVVSLIGIGIGACWPQIREIARSFIRAEDSGNTDCKGVERYW